MMLLIGSLTIGLILSLLALGVYISFKVFSFADITTEGSLTLGAAVAAVLIVRGVNPLAATLAGYALCWVGMRLVRPWIAYAGLLYFVATLVFLTGLITIHAGLLK